MDTLFRKKQTLKYHVNRLKEVKKKAKVKVLYKIANTVRQIGVGTGFLKNPVQPAQMK